LSLLDRFTFDLPGGSPALPALPGYAAVAFFVLLIIEVSASEVLSIVVERDS
jgi:hypothetical protein